MDEKTQKSLDRFVEIFTSILIGLLLAEIISVWIFSGEVIIRTFWSPFISMLLKLTAPSFGFISTSVGTLIGVSLSFGANYYFAQKAKKKRYKIYLQQLVVELSQNMGILNGVLASRLNKREFFLYELPVEVIKMILSNPLSIEYGGKGLLQFGRLLYVEEKRINKLFTAIVENRIDILVDADSLIERFAKTRDAIHAFHEFIEENYLSPDAQLGKEKNYEEFWKENYNLPTFFRHTKESPKIRL